MLLLQEFDFEVIAMLVKAMYTGRLELNAGNMFTLGLRVMSAAISCQPP